MGLHCDAALAKHPVSSYLTFSPLPFQAVYFLLH